MIMKIQYIKTRVIQIKQCSEENYSLQCYKQKMQCYKQKMMLKTNVVCIPLKKLDKNILNRKLGNNF